MDERPDCLAAYTKAYQLVTSSKKKLTLEQLQALPDAELAARRDAAARRLTASGAHLVIDSVAQLPRALAEIEARMARARAVQALSLKLPLATKENVRARRPSR